jgi:AcrR family transcriptional regulator
MYNTRRGSHIRWAAEPMATPKRRTPRSYLTAPERRGQLLAAGAELVGKRGWEALGMVPLAEAAGVSRQLVYEHFENLHSLRLEVTRHLFEEMFQAGAKALERFPDDLAAAARSAVRLQLELPLGARLALAEMGAGSAGSSGALRRLRACARQQITETWAAAIRRHAKVELHEARALAWMMTVASWSLFDLVADGTFTPDQAADFYVVTTLGAIAALDSKG